MPSTNSFWQLLNGDGATTRTVVPLLQRDYAQGRTDAPTTEIRQLFVAALRGAFGPDGKAQKPLGLDFVYGTPEQAALVVLDGQQRLTTLFLLHWYLAAGAALAARAAEDARAALHRFAYEGRAAARDFCRALVETLPTGIGRPGAPDALSAALRDQHWFVPAWHHDPTVRGMLTMLDALDGAFADLPAAGAWAALTGPAEQAAVRFQFLDLKTEGLSDDLYTRMNARGKPLTAFENWKARFDEMLAAKHSAETAKSFANKLEGPWTDFFWRNKINPTSADDDDPATLVDAPFQAFIDFATRMLALRAMASGSGTASVSDKESTSPFVRYEAVYAAPDTGEANLNFLTKALDALAEAPLMPAFFDSLLRGRKETDEPVGGNAERPRLFVDWDSKPADTNLLRSCCQAMTAGPVEKTLFFTVLAYGAHGGKWKDNTVLADLLRIVRNRLLAFRWAGKFSFDLNSSKLDKELPTLLAEIIELVGLTLQHNDAYAALDAWPILPKGFEPECQKIAWLRPGSRLRTRLLAVEDSKHFRGALHLLNSAEWPDDAVLNNVLQALENLWLNLKAVADPAFISLVVRALAATPGACFYEATSTYRFWGGGGYNWNILLTCQDEPTRTLAFQRFAHLFCEGAGDWKSRLDYVREQQIPDRRKDALANNGWDTTKEEMQWPYYMARYAGMTHREGWRSSGCFYKWRNFHGGNQEYQSCALLRLSTMRGDNFHPFAWAAVQEWKDSATTNLNATSTVSLDSPEEDGSTEKPLRIVCQPDPNEKPEIIRLFYGHISPCGWRLELPNHLELDPSLKGRFEWRTRDLYPENRHVRQTWLVGMKHQELDHIETILEFAKALAVPNSLRPRQPVSAV